MVMNAELVQLLTSAARTIFLAGIAVLGLAAFRVKSISVRLFVWRTVLVAALVMPFLGRLLPALPTSAPAFLTHFKFLDFDHSSSAVRDISDTQPIAGATSRPAANNDSVPASPLPHAEHSRSMPQTTKSSHRVPWEDVPAALYLIVTSIFVVRFVLGFVFARRLVQSSQQITDPRMTLVLTSHSAQSPLPQVVESDLISIPVTIGAVRSTILLPSDWPEWDDAKLNAVLAHEVSHVARHDALTQSISLLHRAVFWFSPLAWWLNRHLAVLAEEASDAAALAGGADRNAYAQTLLGFFATLQTAPGRVWWQGVSMANGGHTERRLEKILDWKGSMTMHLKKTIAVAIVMFAVPVVYVVASVRPASHSQISPEAQGMHAADGTLLQAPAPPSSVPPMPTAPAVGVSTTGAAPIAPIAPPLPAAPAAPVSSNSSYAGQSSATGYSYAYGYDDEDRFIIVSGKSDSFTMSGSTQDIHHVQRLKRQIPGDFIWFQRDEKSYIIRDQATIDRAKAFWAPQEELGKKQEELGKQQEALGKQQEEMGSKMEQVRVNVPDMTAELDNLKAKLQKLGPSATMEQIGDLQSEIGELQSKIGEIQSKAGEQQSKLGEEQGKLGEKQGKLGEQQGELGRRQGELAREAAIKMKALLDEAIKNGKAQPESDGSQGASL